METAGTFKTLALPCPRELRCGVQHKAPSVTTTTQQNQQLSTSPLLMQPERKKKRNRDEATSAIPACFNSL
ncbi:hypothetical protein Y032_0165g30 [Ancylostoma ceylanicum]|nr:hypothetical protein Y032_0165g30 [Ancylostoma ceylanicum]